MLNLFSKKKTKLKNAVKNNIFDVLIILTIMNVALFLLKVDIIVLILTNTILLVGLSIFALIVLTNILTDEQYKSLKETIIDFKTFYAFYNNQSQISEFFNNYESNMKKADKFTSINDLLNKCESRDIIVNKYSEIRNTGSSKEVIRLLCKIDLLCSSKTYNLIKLFEEKGAKFLIYLRLFKIINKDDIQNIINIDSILYEYKRNVFKLIENIYSFKYLGNNDELINNRTIIMKASNLNEDIYNLDEEVTDKYMCENLYNTWFLMTVLNMIDNDMIIDKKLLNALINIESIVAKNRKESLKINESINVSYKNKKKEIWSKQIDDFETLTSSIKDDIK